ncbi:MAG: tRNA lysidine(34) synthetase TilS [Elusimicrobia bacterium GWA2_69_24]|nr:MAG: tRNA lysidine(34) synthetase TilS [Elusimicrobia bacterium GWA2_69_24]HBL17304.1 tRNA lysidine(34) synthetase TilS [Elusimicrobiota bacterium]
MPQPKSLLSRLAAFDRKEGLLQAGDRVLAAVSGGADSVCLAHHLSRLAGKGRITVAIAHFHHGLRGRDADRDAAFVRRLAGRLGAPFILERLPVSATAERDRRSLEDAGRHLRYRALERIARRRNANKIATGHHMDDQAETLLLHLLRGTKAKGLAGIPACRPLGRGPGEVVRPLLALDRSEILRYCRAYGLRFRSDRSNRSDRFTRNWIRREILPRLELKNPRIREHLCALAADVQRLTRTASI